MNKRKKKPSQNPKSTIKIRNDCVFEIEHMKQTNTKRNDDIFAAMQLKCLFLDESNFEIIFERKRNETKKELRRRKWKQVTNNRKFQPI